MKTKSFFFGWHISFIFTSPPKHGQQKTKPQTAKNQASVDGCLRGMRQPQGILTDEDRRHVTVFCEVWCLC